MLGPKLVGHLYYCYGRGRGMKLLRESMRAVEVCNPTLFGVLFSSGLAAQSTFVSAVYAVDAIIFLRCVLCAPPSHSILDVFTVQ